MMVGDSQVLTCPFCGKEKEIISLVSGNSFNAEYWSDNKVIAPMFPEISFVQKCPHCGKYYIRTRQEVRFDKENMSFEKGLLSYKEMKEAFAQLSEEGYEEPYEEPNVRMMLHFAYNDFYYRGKDHPDVAAEDWELFVSNAKWLMENVLTDSVLIAEYHREIREFDKALSLLASRERTDDDFLEQFVDAVREKAENKDNRVFLIG